MTTSRAVRQFLRDAAAATAAVVGLYGLGVGVQFGPVQVPGYLLVVGFDAVERLAGPFASFELAFATYLVCLGLAGGCVATAARRRGAATDGWRVGAGAALAVVGVGSLLFGLWTLAWAGDPTPFAVTAATGLVLLAAAGWLVGVPGGGSGPRRRDLRSD